jgi:hypothetical protein
MKRWYIYAGAGLVFGVIDWFYLDWLAHISWGSLGASILVIPIIILMNYGIWLVPIIPAVIIAARKGQRIWDPILIGIITWIFALVGYYAYYWALLSLGKLPNLGHLNVFGEKFAGFHLEYWRMFRRVISSQFLEWSLIAILGGGVIGALAWWIFRKKDVSPSG